MTMVVVTLSGVIGGAETYSTEMVQLDVMGGTLPPGYRIRESPSIASTGVLTIRAVPTGYVMTNYIDVFTELSPDGVMTWIQQPDAETSAPLGPPISIRMDTTVDKVVVAGASF